MKHSIIMFDVDGVLLNHQYKITNKNVIKKFEKMISAGFEMVPNSDTPIRRLEYIIRKKLSFSPNIIIGEKGAVIKHYTEILFIQKINGIQSTLKEIAAIFLKNNIKVFWGDCPIWIMKKKRFPPHSKMVFIDWYRINSICLFFLRTDYEGRLFVDPRWGQEGLEIVLNISLPDELDRFEYNASYGVAISNIKNITKTSGYLLIKRIYPNAQYFMIGDSDTDIIEDESVIHLCVANASPKLKTRSIYVASKNYTDGLEKCLDWIFK